MRFPRLGERDAKAHVGIVTARDDTKRMQMQIVDRLLQLSYHRATDSSRLNHACSARTSLVRITKSNLSSASLAV